MTTMLAPAIDQSARFRNGVVHDVEWDVYLYGWREVPHPSPNGTSQMVRIPLTRKDVLHPQVGDFRMHSDNHERFCIYLYNVLTAQLADDPTAVVLHDVRVAWAAPDVDPHGPDLAVIWDVKVRKNWSTFDEKMEKFEVADDTKKNFDQNQKAFCSPGQSLPFKNQVDVTYF